MKKITFLLTEPNPVRGPYTLSQLRQMWAAGEITAKTKLFATENDGDNRTVMCLSLRAEQIQEHLEDGTEIKMDELGGWKPGRG